MTLNGEMALILFYFIKFGSYRDALRKSGRETINMDNYD